MLSTALTYCFADSRLEVDSFTRDEKTLTLRIEKEIGPETGQIMFRNVSFVSLPSTMPGDGIRAKPVREAGPEFWSRCLLEPSWFEPNEVLFEIFSQDGPVYFIVATSVSYKIVS